MTLYARRDAVHVAVSVERGGCGAGHSRPVTHGVPAAEWALTCPPCERNLLNDPLWAGTRAEVPETPDEITQREQLEKRGVRDRETVITAALAKIAGIAGDAQLPVSPVICKHGHQNLPSSRFCGECGMSLSPEEPSHHATVQAMAEPAVDLDYSKLPVAELRQLATKRNLNPARSKRDLIEALSR